jgi:predicted DNA-binding protein (UPF0251 family)
LEEIVLAMDELEAIRLADLEGLYQDAAAERMGVSRQTFGRIIQSARRKVAETLTRGLALRIEGGRVETVSEEAFECPACRHVWPSSEVEEGLISCPLCGASGGMQPKNGSNEPGRFCRGGGGGMRRRGRMKRRFENGKDSTKE